MLVYPQLASGAMTQFPMRKRRRLRTVVNAMADGSTIKFADPGAETIEWALEYAGLSDAEMAALEQFFAAAEGTLGSFTFLDPGANLLAWSERLEHAAWQRDPLLTISGGAGNWQVHNTGGGAQSLSQTLAAPAGYLYCFSAYVRAAQAATVTLQIGDTRGGRSVAGAWSRIALAATGGAAGESIRFGLEVPAGVSLEVYGLQAEAQAVPSAYKVSTRGGVYEGARLREDVLRTTATAVNQHSCTVNVYYANHL